MPIFPALPYPFPLQILNQPLEGQREDLPNQHLQTAYAKQPCHCAYNPPMPEVKLTDRDKRILRFIHDYGGLVNKSHIEAREFPSEDSARKRLDLLVSNNYLTRPRKIKDPDKGIDIDEARDHPNCQGCYWLGWRGAIWVAQDQGKVVNFPEEPDSDQLTTLQKRLAKLGFLWRSQPNWDTILHELRLVEVHLAIEIATKLQPGLAIAEWIHEDQFRAQPLNFSQYPDAYVAITDKKNHSGAAARFLLEIDRTTHPHNRLLAKLQDGIKLLRSPEFRNLTGSNDGRFALVLDSKPRLEEIHKKTTQEFGDLAYLFLFSTFDEVNTDPLGAIWLSGHKTEKAELLVENF